ncbi:MAG TPA: hypothetical protein VJ826_06175 [Candidatus Polarisedimenticolaceae bacterium]|nr:hypothetical protein [Candidatus Polarisedimenticolaceae bacterium]
MSARPDALAFFTDRDLGKQFPGILAQAGLVVHRHADHFAPDCPDDVWLEAVAERKWIAISRDARIRYKPNELAAVIRHGARLLIVIGKAPHSELAANFVATIPAIVSFVAAQRAPWIGKVYRPTTEEVKDDPTCGRVELWYPQPG